MARINGNAGTRRRLSGSVRKWARETEEAAVATLHLASKNFRAELLANTPIDTGNLRASLLTSAADLGSGPNIKAGPYQEYGSAGNETAANNVIDGLYLGDQVYFVYRAPYAMRLEYGFTGIDSLGRQYNQAGRFWIKRTGDRWPAICRAAATQLYRGL